MLSIVNDHNQIAFRFFLKINSASEKILVKHKCLLISSCQNLRNVIFVIIKGLWWWFWRFVLNGVYLSNFHHFSTKWLHSYPNQHWLFSERFELWHEKNSSLMSASVIPAAAESPTPGHSKFINYNLISLKILFGSVKDKLPSFSVNKILGVFLIWG